MSYRVSLRWVLLPMLAALLAVPAFALTPQDARALATGEVESRIAALHKVLPNADDKTIALIQAMSDDAVKTTDTAVIVMKDDKGHDPVTGAEVPVPEAAEDIINNNEMRSELDAALASVKLASPDATVRAAAVKTLASEPDESKLPIIEKAYASEQTPAIKDALGALRAAMLLGSSDRTKRLGAAKSLGATGTPATKTLLIDQQKVETDPEVKGAIIVALGQIEGRLAWGEKLGVIFTGVSLGSILLLAALGLAITYG
jgi:urea transport system permease protein